MLHEKRDNLGIIYDYFIIFWGFLLITLMGIGGFFMFRKFLKALPKSDGLSQLDWQNYYIEQTRHMWSDEQLTLLDELVSPVPELFRDIAREKIAGKIGEIALKKGKDNITQEILIEGYIIATPKRDHKFLRTKMAQKKISLQPYEHLFE